MELNSRNNLAYLFLLFGLVVAILCYIPGLSEHFLLDDFENIINNDELNIERIDTENLVQAAFSITSQIQGRPLSMISFALNKYYFGDSAVSFKVINLLIHLINGLLVFMFSYLLMLAIQQKNNLANLKISPRWFAAILSTIWLIHPINTTGVLYVVQRMTSLAALFGLLSIIFYLLQRLRQLRVDNFSISYLALSATFLLASILCKENGVLVFLFILLIEFFIFQFSRRDNLLDKKIIIAFSILLFVPLIIFITWLIPNIGVLASIYDSKYYSMQERLFTELRVVSSYIKWIIAPNIQELSLYHDGISVSTGLFKPVSTFASLLFLSTVISLVLLLKKAAPLVSFGLAFFFTGHLLESTIYPLEFSFEHRNYLPSIGILIALLSAIFYKFTFDKKIFIGICLLFLLLSVTTLTRSERWHDPILFAEISAANKPNSLRAQLTRANHYVNAYAKGTYNDKERVLEYLNKACEVDKHGISAHMSRLISAPFLNIDIPDNWYDEINQILNDYPISSGSIVHLKDFVNFSNINPSFYEKSKIDTLFKHAFSSKNIAKQNFMQSNLLTIYSNYLSTDPNNYFLAYELLKKALSLSPNEPRVIVNLAQSALVLGKFDEVEELIAQLENLTLFDYTRNDVKSLKNNYQRILNNSVGKDR